MDRIRRMCAAAPPGLGLGSCGRRGPASRPPKGRDLGSCWPCLGAKRDIGGRRRLACQSASRVPKRERCLGSRSGLTIVLVYHATICSAHLYTDPLSHASRHMIAAFQATAVLPPHVECLPTERIDGARCRCLTYELFSMARESPPKRCVLQPSQLHRISPNSMDVAS
eukprot:9496050-Pyramimonas_sp.AAC.1